MDLKYFQFMNQTTNAARYNCALACVDIAIISSEAQKILLGRKPGQIKFRFPGGFVDHTKDKSYEEAALREAKEECGDIELTSPLYLGSRQIDDPRYRNDKDRIFSAFFGCQYIFGIYRANDDLAEVKWFPIEDLTPEMLVPEHAELLDILQNKVKLLVA
jgi:bifunctional NMN adenylyltransferase/nudix hydrolase